MFMHYLDSLHVTCGLTACIPGSAPGPTLGNEYGKTLPFTFLLPYKTGNKEIASFHLNFVCWFANKHTTRPAVRINVIRLFRFMFHCWDTTVVKYLTDSVICPLTFHVLSKKIDMVLDIVANMVNAECVHIRWLEALDALCPLLVLFGAYSWVKDSLSVTRWLFWRVSCLLAKQHATFKWKDVGLISIFAVLQGSAETLIRWGGKLYHLSTAYFLRHSHKKLSKSNDACSSNS